MSDKFFERMRELVPELLKQLNDEEKKEFDREIERVTGKDCDQVAETTSAQEFQRLARVVYARVKRKKSMTNPPEAEVAAYA